MRLAGTGCTSITHTSCMACVQTWLAPRACMNAHTTAAVSALSGRPHGDRHAPCLCTCPAVPGHLLPASPPSPPQVSLLSACKRGDLDALLGLLDSGTAVNVVDEVRGLARELRGWRSCADRADFTNQMQVP